MCDCGIRAWRNACSEGKSATARPKSNLSSWRVGAPGNVSRNASVIALRRSTAALSASATYTPSTNSSCRFRHINGGAFGSIKQSWSAGNGSHVAGNNPLGRGRHICASAQHALAVVDLVGRRRAEVLATSKYSEGQRKTRQLWATKSRVFRYTPDRRS